MTIRRLLTGMFCLGLITLMFSVSFVQAEMEVEGRSFYTRANIWFERAEKIPSVNYHKGRMIPVGTKVMIKRVNDKEIKFSDNKGMDFKIEFSPKYSSYDVDIWAYFERYFSVKSPMLAGGEFEKLTGKEQAGIKAGEIKTGMSKKAVLMAYGYPPGHKTPSLDGDTWLYWVNRFKKLSVYFKNDKVLDITR